MSIPSRRISRVIIAGEWFTVALGTFKVVDMDFTDENGESITGGPIGMKAYHFLTDNKDEYYGPLSHISLIKLLDI